jgi:molybdopterin/thiamine biosynthesis adenylyltransferase
VPSPSSTDEEAARHQYASLQAVAPGGALLRIITSREGHVWAAVRTSEFEREQPLQEIRLHGPGGVRILRPFNAPVTAGPALRAVDARYRAVLGDESFAKMRCLHIAVVGLGGVGSMVARLSASLAARLILIDPDHLQPHNAPRVWYAGAGSRGAKVTVAKRALKRAFPGLQVTARKSAFPSRGTISLIRQADLVFACPDHLAVRDSASRIAAAEMLPLIEVGCGGRRDEGRLSSLGYHVRLQIPGGPCLACNGLDTSRLEDPETTRAKRILGYIEDGEEVAGELGCLTTRAAADAVDVLMRYWTGYAGPPLLHLYVDALRFKSLDLSHFYASRPECPICGGSSWRWSNQGRVTILRSPARSEQP